MRFRKDLWSLGRCKNDGLRLALAGALVFFSLHSSYMCLHFYLNNIAIFAGAHICIESVTAGTNAFTFWDVLNFGYDWKVRIIPFRRRFCSTLLATLTLRLFL